MCGMSWRMGSIRVFRCTFFPVCSSWPLFWCIVFLSKMLILNLPVICQATHLFIQKYLILFMFFFSLCLLLLKYVTAVAYFDVYVLFRKKYISFCMFLFECVTFLMAYTGSEWLKMFFGTGFSFCLQQNTFSKMVLPTFF